MAAVLIVISAMLWLRLRRKIPAVVLVVLIVELELLLLRMLRVLVYLVLLRLVVQIGFV
jgi:hypothetical protein